MPKIDSFGPAASSWTSNRPASPAGGTTVKLELSQKAMDRLAGEAGIPRDRLAVMAGNVRGAMTLSPDQMKTLAANASDKEKVYEAYGQALKQMDGGKSPSWLDSRNKKGNIDFRNSAKGLDSMNLAEADYLYVSLRGMGKKAPDAQGKLLSDTVNNRPYYDIDADQVGWQDNSTTEQKAQFVEKTFAVRMAAVKILAGAQ